MTSNIEKIIAVAHTFVGATIDVQWQNAYGYVEKADVDGFDIHWGDWGDEEPCIRFWATNLRRELHFLRSPKVEQLEVEDDHIEFIFPVSGIEGVWNCGTTTQMRILEIKDERDLSGPMRVVLTKD